MFGDNGGIRFTSANMADKVVVLRCYSENGVIESMLTFIT